VRKLRRAHVVAKNYGGDWIPATHQGPQRRTQSSQKGRNAKRYTRIMCGRYYRVDDKQAIAEYFLSAPADDELLPLGFNIAPTTRQPVIR
jgi:hypothetical protein